MIIILYSSFLPDRFFTRTYVLLCKQILNTIVPNNRDNINNCNASFILQSEEEQRAGSLPRLPSITGTNTVPAGPVKSARYRAPGFRTATRAASAPGLHVPRRRRPPPTPLQPPPAAPASAPSLQGKYY